MYQTHSAFPLMVNINKNDSVYTKQPINALSADEAILQSTNEEPMSYIRRTMDKTLTYLNSLSALRLGPDSRPPMPSTSVLSSASPVDGREECRKYGVCYVGRFSRIQRTQKPHAALPQANDSHQQHAKSHAPSGPRYNKGAPRAPTAMPQK